MQTQIMTGIIILSIKRLPYNTTYYPTLWLIFYFCARFGYRRLLFGLLGILCSIKNWDIGTKIKKFYEGYITCYIYLGTITLSVLWDDFYMTWDITLCTG